MWEVLKPGGTIVTLASPSWTFGSQKKQQLFRDWLKELNVEPVTIAEGSFKESGTAIQTVLLTIVKPLVYSPVPWQIKKKGTEAPAPALSLTKFSEEELSEFDDVIIRKLGAAEKEYTYLVTLLEKPEYNDTNPETEQLKLMRDRQATYIDALKAAQERIQNKTYGICAETGQMIDKARLRAVPHATLCIEAKRQQGKEEAQPVSKNIKVRSCRVCGCTEDNCQKCVEKTGHPCHWVAKDLCSACQEHKDPEEILQDIEKT
ncbi:MAG: TraR/DksA family transcriptional regulator, partial [Chitinophagaceae bacterium]